MEKVLAVKDATYAVAQRKPDKNEKFRLAARDSNPDLCDTGAVFSQVRIILLLDGIQYLTYTLYTYFTSAHLQCTHSEHFQ